MQWTTCLACFARFPSSRTSHLASINARYRVLGTSRRSRARRYAVALCRAALAHAMLGARSVKMSLGRVPQGRKVPHGARAVLTEAIRASGFSSASTSAVCHAAKTIAATRTVRRLAASNAYTTAVVVLAPILALLAWSLARGPARIHPARFYADRYACLI